MREVLICRSDYSRDGQGVVVRHAFRLAGSGAVFVRHGEKLLVNGPESGVEYPADVVGWIAKEDAQALAVGEWGKGELREKRPPRPPKAPPPTTRKEPKEGED